MSPRPRVLLVDDEDAILSALERTLRREGYEILCADGARAALRLLAAEPVDLILSDQKMPGSSGLALLGEAARLRPGAARLLLTGWPEEVPAAALERGGVHALLPKPWDAQELKATVRRLLARGAAAG